MQGYVNCDAQQLINAILIIDSVEQNSELFCFINLRLFTFLFLLCIQKGNVWCKENYY